MSTQPEIAAAIHQGILEDGGVPPMEIYRGGREGKEVTFVSSVAAPVSDSDGETGDGNPDDEFHVPDDDVKRSKPRRFVHPLDDPELIAECDELAEELEGKAGIYGLPGNLSLPENDEDEMPKAPLINAPTDDGSLLPFDTHPKSGEAKRPSKAPNDTLNTAQLDTE